MKISVIGAAVFAALCLSSTTFVLAGTPAPAPVPSAPAVYADPKAPVEARVNDLLKRLNPDEKLNLLALDGSLQTHPIPRLNVPPFRMADAPNGVRDGQSTAFPLGISLASTWNPALVRQVGVALGQECLGHNRQVLFGPCVNIHRTPQGGRNGESFSEDPFLSARMAVAYIDGIQSQGVSACVKHFAFNNQETQRHSINISVDERTMREIELPAFEAAFREAHSWSTMAAFNQLNGAYITANPALLQNTLEREWRWDGFVVSDWGAIHETVGAINAGTDLELPTPAFFTPAHLQEALDKKQITQTTIDERVRRLLRAMVRTGNLDGPRAANPKLINTPAHQVLARKVAQQGIVLLKNAGNILPLDRHKIKSIAIVGPNANPNSLGGRWSADVAPFYSVSPLDGLKTKAGAAITVNYAAGTGAPFQDAVDAAKKSDVAIVVVGLNKDLEGEELDPSSLNLPAGQDDLIQAVAAANKNTVVVLVNGTPILSGKWIDKVPGLIEAWYAGQEAGNALADVLFGDVNPSGKLTDTVAFKREDYSDLPNYPGTNGTVKYAEGIYVGYRHFDEAKIAPQFPFGFGLSYTTFAYSNLKAPAVQKPGVPVQVSLVVQNTGKRAGAEIVELYVHDLAPKVDRPIRELKGFARVSLAPGQKGVVTIPLDDRAFAFYNVALKKWKSNPGRYEIQVGASSRDIRQTGVITLP